MRFLAELFGDSITTTAIAMASNLLAMASNHEALRNHDARYCTDKSKVLSTCYWSNVVYPLEEGLRQQAEEASLPTHARASDKNIRIDCNQLLLMVRQFCDEKMYNVKPDLLLSIETSCRNP